jgi:DNA-binding MarR family transcriptional regulator
VGTVTTLDDSAVVKSGRTKVLQAVAEEDGQTGSEVLEKVSLSQPYVSSTLSDLVEEGLLEREVSSDDGRKKEYTITEEGLALLDVLDGIYAEA